MATSTLSEKKKLIIIRNNHFLDIFLKTKYCDKTLSKFKKKSVLIISKAAPCKLPKKNLKSNDKRLILIFKMNLTTKK